MVALFGVKCFFQSVLFFEHILNQLSTISLHFTLPDMPHFKQTDTHINTHTHIQAYVYER